MAAITIGTGYYRRTPAGEGSVIFRLDLPQAAAQTVIVDLGAQSWPKYLFQPGRIRVGSRINATGDLAGKSTNLLITTTSSDIASLRPYSRNMAATDQGYSISLSPGRNMPLAFELDIPYEKTRQHDIGNLMVQIIDRDQGRLLGQVTFVVRNSRAGIL